MKRIWFNYWFSSVYHISNLIRKDTKEEYYIVSSCPYMNDLVKLGADEFFLEPKGLNEEFYVAYCLSICKNKKIDLFIPRYNRVAISKYRHKFESIGTKVMTEKYEIMTILDNKSDTYDLLENSELNNLVPRYKVVKTREEFYEAINYIGRKICVKKPIDEGASTFKVLKPDNELYNDNMSYSEFCNTYLDKEDTEYMVMEYLTDEVNCDTVFIGKECIPVFRQKTAKRIHTVTRNTEVEEYAKRLAEKLNLSMPCSIQFRVSPEGYKLLEINTRMSGGVQISSEGSGINIPLVGVRNILGADNDYKECLEKLNTLPKNGILLTNFETPIIVRR